MKTETPDNSFLATAQRHEGGIMLNEMSTALADVVRGVMATGGKGKVTLVLDVERASRGNNALVLSHEVKTKIPVEKVNGSFWFGTDDGQLVKNDTRQQEMRFQEEPVVVVQGGADHAPASPKVGKVVNE